MTGWPSSSRKRAALTAPAVAPTPHAYSIAPPPGTSAERRLPMEPSGAVVGWYANGLRRPRVRLVVSTPDPRRTAAVCGEHLHPVEWCVDTRVLGAARCAEAEICTHLTRHAIDPLVVELARPLVRDALATRTGTSWVTLDWELQTARLHIRVLPERPLPGTLVAPGVSRAHHHAAQLATAHPDVEGVTLELGVARAPEPDVDVAAGDPRTVPDGTPAALAAVITDGMAAGQSVEEAAARAGATVAAAHATGAEPDEAAASVAERFVQAER